MATLTETLHTNEHPVLLFDGVCNLCNASVQWVLLRDKKGLFRFAALQSEVGQHLLKARGMSGETLDSVVVVSGGRVLTHSDAPLEVARLLGGGWSLLYIFRWIPRSIRDGIYRFIARNRYRWFGKQESCMLPRPEWKERFLS
ncbi:MAG TPA: DCC1-like thiol-disulfide oxidoreductase family protein [Saprospiraceae bacterium]|nr:DCC1-like thiol-disulfide oxidoreductase family protein [Saprospiraceae bacterium]